MNLFDQDCISRFRKLKADLAWAITAPWINAPGQPFKFTAGDSTITLQGPFGSQHPRVVIHAPTLFEQVRNELIRRGWVYQVNGATFVVAVGRYLRQPVGTFQQVPPGPPVVAGPDDTSKDKQHYPVGVSELEYPRDTLA